MSVATLRLLPAPESAPPYDDELPHPVVLPTAPVRLAAPALRLVQQPEPVPEDDAWSRPRTGLDRLPPVRQAAGALVQRLVEVQAGVRPVRQLLPLLAPDLYASVEGWLLAHARRSDGGRVRSVHAQTRSDGSAEAVVTVTRRTPSGPRVQALALRLEGVDGRWCCTALEGL